MSNTNRVTAEAFCAAVAKMPSSSIILFGQQLMSYGQTLQIAEQANARVIKERETILTSITAIARLMNPPVNHTSITDEDILKLTPDNVLVALQSYPLDHWRILTSERVTPSVAGNGTCTFFHECTRHGYYNQILTVTKGGVLPEGDIRTARDSYGRTASSFSNPTCLPPTVSVDNVISLLKAFPTYWMNILTRSAVDDLGRNLQTCVIFAAAAKGLLDEIEAVLKELTSDHGQIEEVTRQWRDPNAMTAREIDQVRKGTVGGVQTVGSVTGTADMRVSGCKKDAAGGG